MTKAEREALEALVNELANWDRNEKIAPVAFRHGRQSAAKDLSALLATLDKPATRYPWADAPEWAMWAATSASGTAHWFRHEPAIAGGSMFWVSTFGEKSVIGKKSDEFCPDWRDSLERRP